MGRPTWSPCTEFIPLPQGDSPSRRRQHHLRRARRRRQRREERRHSGAPRQLQDALQLRAGRRAARPAAGLGHAAAAAAERRQEEVKAFR